MIYTLEEIKALVSPIISTAVKHDERPAPIKAEEATAAMMKIIEQDREAHKITGATSDGYHTFDELYDHRIALFIALITTTDLYSWRSFKHDDGSKYDGWFIAGIDLPTGTISYHLPEKYWDRLTGYCEPLDKAPKWDGHTPADVVERLNKWSTNDGSA